MLGTLQAESDGHVISRFRTRRVGLLLAYLAYYRERAIPRDELADLLWPEFEAELARRNLRQALSSLRHHLEPPRIPRGAILISKQGRVSLNPELLTTDVGEFCELVRSAGASSSASQKIRKLERAVSLYRGDFLPGYYEDWVQQERRYLDDLFVSALQNLIQVCRFDGRVEEALRYVRLALSKDVFREDLHEVLMQLYIDSQRPASALEHYREWKDLLRAELNEEPGPEIAALAARAERESLGAPKVKRQELAVETDSEEASPHEPGTSTVIARLPVQLTRFFGREADRKMAVRALTDNKSRLVTLMGPAGAGKTRLSIEVGRVLSQDHGWNVWFVPFADLADGATALHSVAEAMRLRTEMASSPVSVIQSNVSGSQNLLILDNLEHILESVIPAVEALIREVPGVSLLITSRQSLKLEGEQEIDLEALPVPDLDSIESGDLDALAALPSVQLFIDRAQAVVPDFQITGNNACAIASICQQLDGLPLALEIAASLSGSFTPSQMLLNLEDRLELLRSRRRDISNRHRSLRAAIDYSFDLLSPDLQRFFVNLSVFRGGFAIAAASEICLSGDVSPTKRKKRSLSDCLRMVLDLQERSLLRTEDALPDCPARFRLLESFREYGAELLSVEDEAALRLRHATYFVQLGKDNPRILINASGDGERDNRLAALQVLFELGNIPGCVILLEALHGFSQAGKETLFALTRSPDFDSFELVHQVKLLRLVANAQLYPSDFEESHRTSLRALEIAKRLGQEDQLVLCHRAVSVAASYLGLREEAIWHDEQILELAKRNGGWLMLENAYNGLTENRWTIGDFEGALEAAIAATDISTKAHDGEPLWPHLYNMSRINLDLGNLEEGMRFASEGLRSTQRHSEDFGVSMFLGLISRYHRFSGNVAAALATSREALTMRRKVGFRYWTLFAFQEVAAVLIQMERYREVATLLAVSRDTVTLRREPDNWEFEAWVETVKGNLTEHAFEQAWAEGLAMSLDDAYRLAMGS